MKANGGKTGLGKYAEYGGINLNVLGIIALAVFLAISSFSLLAVASDGPGPGGGSGSGGQPDPAMNRAMQCNMFSYMYMNGSEFSGNYMRFTHRQTSIENLTSCQNQAVVFSEIEIGDSQGAYASGSMAQLNGSKVRARLHNMHSLMVTLRNQAGEGNCINLTVGSGITVSKAENGNLVMSGACEGYLVLEDCNATVEGNKIQIQFRASTGSATFRQKSAGSEQYRNTLNEMIRDGAVGGEMDVVVENTTHASSSEGYAHHVNMQVMNAGKGSLKIRVSAEFKEGKIFRIGLDKTSGDTDSGKNLKLKLDGQEIKQVSLSEMAQYRNQNRTEACYCIEENANGYDVFAYIPHFSDHDITIEKLAEETGSSLPGFAALPAVIVVAVLSALYISYRRMS